MGEHGERPNPQKVGVVLFEGFELLDVFGPLEMYGALPDRFEVQVLGPVAGPVRSAQGPAVVPQLAYDEAVTPDVVLVPGGVGTRALARDDGFLGWLAAWAAAAPLITSVCTGAGLLAAAGLLDGHRATSNKRAFSWVTEQSSRVEWVATARWVEDRNRWTSGGVAAGMDMTLAVIARLHGVEVATTVADRVEYEWHRDPAWDPFAAKNGLDPT